jgi:hypothetical protein
VARAASQFSGQVFDEVEEQNQGRGKEVDEKDMAHEFIGGFSSYQFFPRAFCEFRRSAR